ncbi:MAG: sporulation protein YqfD [Firmicutes bacterium]|mgnify:CR=1 FL=1|nr:sporulation protein YqfD [Bacillota bacterium]
MFILKLQAFITGFLVIAITGRNAEKLINLALYHDIPLWDLQKETDKIVLKIDLDSFYTLRRLALRTGCRLRILHKGGFPFLYHRFTRRRGLVLGLCFFIFSLYFISSFILFVSVEGNEVLQADYIRRLAAECGAYPGMFKQRLNKNEVVNQMLLAEPQLEWVGLHVQGTRLLIEVVEDTRPPLEVEGPANLVAAKDGLITEVIVINGEARVEPGETVRRGQLLVEGVLQPQYTPDETGEPAPVPVRARGEVMARVWYEGYGEAALTETVRERTGSKATVWTLLVDGQSVLKVGRTEVPFSKYETEKAAKSFSERIIRFPVEIVTETHYEVLESKKSISKAQALEIARQRAKALAEFQLPSAVKIERRTYEKVLDEQDLVGVRYVIETVENIAAAETIDGGERKFDS